MFLTQTEIAVRAPSVFATSPHESRSEKYHQVRTDSILDRLFQAGFGVVHAQQGKSKIEGKAAFTKHMLRFRQEKALEIRGGVFPEVVVMNSHDGTSAYHVFLGLFRVVCTNGLVAGTTFKSFRFGHSARLAEDVLDASFEIVDQAAIAHERIALMQARTLGDDDVEMFARAAHALRFGDRSDDTAVRPRQLLEARRTADKGNSVWEVMNRVQENAMTGVPAITSGGIRIPRRRFNEAHASAQFNRDLWDLAEAFV